MYSLLLYGQYVSLGEVIFQIHADCMLVQPHMHSNSKRF